VDLIARGEMERLEQLIRDMKEAVKKVGKSKAPIVQ
jgi:hypothetical protein